MDNNGLTTQERETLWDTWLMDLQPWERHWIFTHHELCWHDSFVHANTPLQTFADLVTDHFTMTPEHLSEVV